MVPSLNVLSMETHCTLVFRYHSDSFICDDVTDNCERYKGTGSIAEPISGLYT